MSKVSKSPDRHSFQKTGYVNRMTEKEQPLNKDYLDLFERIIDDHAHKFDDPESRKNNMEYDLLTTDWILEKARDSESYSQNIYSAICNNDFQKLEVIPVLKGETWGASWRSAGGIVADMRQEGDYINWYCSGIGNKDTGYGLSHDQTEATAGYVPEGCITDEIRCDLQRLGWAIVPGGDWEKFKKENEK
jgi:hypothetical protein